MIWIAISMSLVNEVVTIYAWTLEKIKYTQKMESGIDKKKRHVWKLKSGSKISRREEDEKDKTIVAARYDGEGFLVCVGAEGKLSR